MKKTTMLAALIATSIGSAAMAAETTPMTTPAAPQTGAAAVPGTTVKPMTTVVVLERTEAGARLGSEMVGADVYSTSGEKLGDVNDLIVDTSGRISALVVGVGGFLGVGEKNVALAWNAVTVGPGEKGRPRLSVDVSRDALDKAAPFVPTKGS